MALLQPALPRPVNPVCTVEAEWRKGHARARLAPTAIGWGH